MVPSHVPLGPGSRRGAFFDSVSDRLTDALLFGGVAWHLASTEPGRIMMLPVAAMAMAMFVSYQRAKAESLGYDAKGGIMERAERFIVLAFGLLFPEFLIVTLWVMLVLTGVTAIQRFVKVWRQGTLDREVSGSPSEALATSSQDRTGVAKKDGWSPQRSQHLDRWSPYRRTGRLPCSPVTLVTRRRIPALR